MEVCVRCERDAPEPPWSLDNGWLSLWDVNGNEYAVICPDCLTREERAAVERFWQGGRSLRFRRWRKS